MNFACNSILSRLSPIQQSVLKVPFSVLAGSSTFLNAVAAGLFLKEKSLRTFSNALLMSLLISDLLIGSVLSPLTVVQLSLPKESPSCTINKINSLISSLLSVPVLTITGIAYERGQYIARVGKCQEYMTTWKKTCLLVIPWITPLLGIASRLLNEKILSCVILAIYITSYSVLIGSYLRLIKFLGKSQIEINRFEDSQAQKNLCKAIYKRNQRVTHLILLIIIAFITCTLWIFIYRILMTMQLLGFNGFEFIETHGPLMFAICLLIFQLNSALNPIMYFAKHQEFKRALVRLLSRRRATRHAVKVTPSVAS